MSETMKTEFGADLEKSRDKTTCPPCDVCGSYNADADGPVIEDNGGVAYECCPNCWYRFEQI